MIDEAKGERAVRFINNLRHTKGRWSGIPFALQQWQEQIVRDIFGTVRSDGMRQYRTAYLEVARKNGKSELAAAIALSLLFADGEAGAEIYGAAADRDQAAIVFDVAVQMIRQAPGLAKRCKIIESTKRIVYPEKASYYRVLSADHATKHGFNAHGIIFDELHTQPNRALWDVLTTSGGTRTQPLVFAITTAGYDRNSICWEQHRYAEQIRDGVIHDETFYPVIYSVDNEDDWTDEAMWYKANPALGTFRDIEEMRQQFNKAKNVPAYQNTFRRLYLNQWTQQADRWLDLQLWDDCSGNVFVEDLYGREAYAGLDLASTTDIAAFVIVVPDEDGSVSIVPYFWVPEEAIENRSLSEGVPYDEWVRRGYIESTPGNVIDYRYIRKRIEELGDQYYIREIAFDRWGATQLIQELGDAGFTVVQFAQTFGSYSPATKELLKLVIDKKVRHGGNPVLRWMADNLVVKQDPAGNIKPDKAKSSEKIDGMVALIMAIDRATRGGGGTVYDERGILTL